MKHNPALLHFWILRVRRGFSMGAYLSLLVVWSSLLSLEGPAWVKASVIGAATLYLFWQNLPWFRTRASLVLGYHPVEGWWIQNNSFSEKIEIEIALSSRLTAFGLCLVYREWETQKSRMNWINTRSLLQGDYRALCRVFRLGIKLQRLKGRTAS